jgi:hypothetical protein
MDFLRRRWYYLIPAFLLGSPLVMLAYVSMSYGYSASDSWTYLQNMDKAGTKFQRSKFSEMKFKRIKPGMMGRDVFEMIGMPLERHDEDTRWLYSAPVGGAPYFHERTLILKKGQVQEVINRLHKPDSK